MNGNLKVCRLGLFAVALIILLGLETEITILLSNPGELIFRQIENNQNKWKIRDNNRWEGIRNRQIVGERIDLLSITIDYIDIRRSNDSLNLGFVLPESSNVDITVQENATNYWMKPLQQKWPAKFNNFSWNSKIIDYFNIELYHLYGTVVILEKSVKTIAPIIFYYRHLPNKIDKYRFIFFSGKKVDLYFKIIQRSTNATVFDGQFLDQPIKQEIEVTWVSRDQNGTSYPDGMYEFVLKANFKFRTKPDEEYSDVWQFYHYNKLN